MTMTLMSVPVVTTADPFAAASSGLSAGDKSGASFAAMFDSELGQLSAQLQKAETGLQDLAAGRAQSLHQVMVDLEKARISMQLLMQVRTRVLEGVQELMRMQV